MNTMTGTRSVETLDVPLPLGHVHLHIAGPDGAPALVLLHGGGPGASGWSNYAGNIPALAERFRVIVPDQAGYGGSHVPSQEQIERGILRHNADVLVQLLDHLAVERAHVVGNSQGGGTALRLALDHPGRVGRLVLMGPMMGGIATTTVEPTEGQRRLVTFYAPPGPSKERLRELLEIMVHDASLVTDELVDARFAAATSPEAASFFAAFGAAFRAGKGVDELWREIDRVEHPTLLLWGRDDRVLPVDSALFMLKRMRDVRLLVFGACGHWVQAERRAEFDRAVIDFVAES